MKKENKTVFVGMSGGVDSSVAAFLLKKQGYNVVGVFMRCWGDGDGPSTGLRASCAERDAEDARRVAGHLGIPFYVWDFEEEYKKRVVDYMVEGYRAGLTPNPDVACNREIKFGLFLQAARRAGADYIATGHYVRLRQHTTNQRIGANTTNKKHAIRSIRSSFVSFALSAARDVQKDQSYFLWTLTQDDLRSCLFPIGEYTKPQVRAIARRAGLPTAEKKDSQGICFLGKVTLADFLSVYIPEKRGEVVTTSGIKIGEHHGAAFYTIGQRHGLDLGTKNRVLGVSGKTETMPHYVAGKDMKTNTVVVAEGSKNPALYEKEVQLANVNFVRLIPSAIRALPVFARVRYRQPLMKARLTIKQVGSSNDPFVVVLTFDKPQKFVAPGQSAVFYIPRRGSSSAKASTFDKSTVDKSEDMEMLGGGIIMDSGA